MGNLTDFEEISFQVLDLRHSVAGMNESVNVELQHIAESLDLLTVVSISLFMLLFVAMAVKLLFSK